MNCDVHIFLNASQSDIKTREGGVVLETLNDVQPALLGQLIAAQVQLRNISVQFKQISDCLARAAAKSVGGKIENLYQFLKGYCLQQIILGEI